MRFEQSPEEQLSALMDTYGHLVFSICYKMTSDYFASEDLSQDTFLSAYRHLGEFDGKYEKAWICRIATNKCIDYLQSAGRKVIPVADIGMEDNRRTEPDVPPGHYPVGIRDVGGGTAEDKTPESICLEEEVRATLLARCGSLKPPYNEVAKLYYYDELDAGEIARHRNMKLKTVQTQIYRARSMLRRLYGKEQAHDT